MVFGQTRLNLAKLQCHLDFVTVHTPSIQTCTKRHSKPQKPENEGLR
jgi:hypothetical protein